MTHQEKIEELRRRHQEAENGGGAERRSKQQAEGKLGARERLNLLFDEGTFEEIDKLVEHRCQDFGMPEQRIPGAAAIASRTAAKVYRARILATHLEDHHENYTRFLLLSKKPSVSPRANKVSIVFATRNVPGALFKCLSVFALRDIDLTKMESRLLRGRPWEYLFYVDFIGSTRQERCLKALAHLGEITNFIRVLGCYPSAKR